MPIPDRTMAKLRQFIVPISPAYRAFFGRVDPAFEYYVGTGRYGPTGFSKTIIVTQTYLSSDMPSDIVKDTRSFRARSGNNAFISHESVTFLYSPERTVARWLSG